MEHFSQMLFLERLRTPQDRQHLLGLYQSCWGHPLPLLSTPELSISPEGVELGLAKLPCIQAQTDTHAGESVCACIQHSWVWSLSLCIAPHAYCVSFAFEIGHSQDDPPYMVDGFN